jgi:leucyl-tRNA synthetase
MATKTKIAAKKKTVAKKPVKKAVAKKATAPKKAPVAKKKVAVKKAVAKAVKPARRKESSGPERYIPANIEGKWQKKWEADGLYRATIDHTKQKFYALTMLPYPSGNLHIGHWYAMTPSDARARFKRMQGYNVMFPMGFDAFGLPAENAAIQRNIHPKKWTYSNIANMRKQMRSMGNMFDWEREAVSADPKYYKWTQWYFLQLVKHGLAYKKFSPVDWCPHCNTTLAREQVVGDKRVCERCGTPVIKKSLDQWYFRITKYADELLKFDGIDWPDRIRALQTNWIGRSEGAHVTFRSERGDGIEIFTTRPDTLWGATFLVLAPEHPLVAELTTPEHKRAVTKYVAEVTRRTDVERESTDKDKEKTGMFTGAYAVNPVNGAKVPIWTADYVLMTYGTGAIMAVPAHDERDFQFALKFGLPIIPVIDRNDNLTKSFALAGTMKEGFAEALTEENIPFEEKQHSLYITVPPQKVARYVEMAQNFVKPGSWNEVIGTHWAMVFGPGDVMHLDSAESDRKIMERCHQLEPNVRKARTTMEMWWGVEFFHDALYHNEYGKMIHSGDFNGTPGSSAKTEVIAWLEKKGYGRGAIIYRLRDWVISRQRFWGAPIPIIYCPEHGQVPVPDEQLPVKLPDKVEWKPTGESPLKLHPSWAKTKCPICGKPATRDTDTLDTFMCSSWYFLRYLSPDYTEGPYDPEEYNYWMPVDTYTGGVEHAVMHLLYSRFFHKALRDMGLGTGAEPMLQLRNQGQILGPDGQRMSKSRGNVIDPDKQVKKYGADVVRAYLMFGYRWADGGPWGTENIEGVSRWLNRVWTLVTETSPAGQASAADARAVKRLTHQTIKKVSADFEAFEFNTIISALMTFTNALYKFRATVEGQPEWDEAITTMLKLMAPVTPHVAEELWARRKGPYSIHTQAWPVFDAAAAAEDEVTLVLQVNGKVRDRITMPAGLSEEDARAAALANESVKRYLEGKEPQKVIVVPGRLVNVVV